MDAPDVADADMAACLADLARVNTLTLARRPTLAFLAQAAGAAPAGRALAILDVGAGEGDMLRAIHRWAGRRGLAVRLTGCDLNPRCVAAARAATPAGLCIHFVQGDAAEVARAEPPDLILSSLVAHHMADAELVGFLAWQDRTARLGWFVNDLERHWLAYHGFRLLSRLARWHPFVRHDGPVSVARGFVFADWERLLAAAGVTGATIARRFPFRWGVGRLRA
jgi:2-polyprenyl-3-methyl-5-hydroxy-6-metoxy-1,4-benzoquinol methylase